MSSHRSRTGTVSQLYPIPPLNLCNLWRLQSLLSHFHSLFNHCHVSPFQKITAWHFYIVIIIYRSKTLTSNPCSLLLYSQQPASGSSLDSINRQVEKENEMHIHSGILCSHEEKWNHKTWCDWKIVIPSEVSQTQKDKCVFSYTGPGFKIAYACTCVFKYVGGSWN